VLDLGITAGKWRRRLQHSARLDVADDVWIAGERLASAALGEDLTEASPRAPATRGRPLRGYPTSCTQTGTKLAGAPNTDVSVDAVCVVAAL
jgi:hypothetical protein